MVSRVEQVNSASLTATVPTRQSFAHKVISNGGSYEGDLTKQITHLLTFRTEGAKYKAARNWGLKVVSPEWLVQSLERGMILEEELFDPMLPRDMQGKGAWDRSQSLKPSLLGKRPLQGHRGGDEARRKLRRTASTRINSQNKSIWSDIQNTNARAMATEHQGGETPLPNDALASFRQQASVDPVNQQREGMFDKCCFCTHGFNVKKDEVLQAHLVAHGGIFVSGIRELEKAEQEHLYAIVPSDWSKVETPSISKSSRITFVNEWWLERCLHQKRFAPADEHVLGTPLSSFPWPDFANMQIASSAFTGIDLLHVGKVTKQLGATYSEHLTQQTTVLVTNSKTDMRMDKARFAQQWRIPIVDARWLWDSIKAEKRLPFDSYRFRVPRMVEANQGEKQSSTLTLTGPQPKHSSTRVVANPESETLVSLGMSETIPEKDGTAGLVTRTTMTRDSTESENSTSTMAVLHESSKPQPLGEVNPNSPSKSSSKSRPVSLGPAQKAPTTMDQKNIDSALSSLIAANLLAANKKKQDLIRAATLDAGDSSSGPRKRENRIRGRVASNLSASNADRAGSLSRATSVDSTATHGQSVDHGTLGSKGILAARRETDSREDSFNVHSLDDLMQGGRRQVVEDESQISSTQLMYKDPESEQQRERLMAKMRGEHSGSAAGDSVPLKQTIPVKPLAIDMTATVGGRRRTTRARTTN